jgi:hypothetical protein
MSVVLITIPDACEDAVFAGDFELATELLKNPATLNLLSPEKRGLLLRSLLKHTPSVAEHFLQVTPVQHTPTVISVADILLQVSPVQVLSQTDEEGNSALHVAVQLKLREELIRKLLQAGHGHEHALIAQLNNKKQNCIHLAVANNDISTLRLLLSSSSSLDVKCLNATDIDGNTPLQLVLKATPWGVYAGCTAIISELVRCGADPMLGSSSSASLAASIISSYPPVISKSIFDALYEAVRSRSGNNDLSLVNTMQALFEQGSNSKLAEMEKIRASQSQKATQQKKKLEELAKQSNKVTLELFNNFTDSIRSLQRFTN